MVNRMMFCALVAIVLVSGMSNVSFAAAVPSSQKAVNDGNKICPVSGEEIGKMGPGAQYEYKGKIYNFCCSACVATFKKNPEKYAKP